jgi:hypothetical protein
MYSKNYDFVPFTLPSRDRYTVTVIDRRPPLPDRYRTVHRSRPLQVTVGNDGWSGNGQNLITVSNLGRKTITIGKGGPKTVTGW